MGYDEFDSYSSSSVLSTMSGKKLAAIVIIVIVGAFFVIQAIFGFPIKDVFRKDITVQAKVVIKDSSGTCIVEPPDKQPRSIPNCPYKVGDTLSVTFKEGTDHIEKFASKS
ncbi:MAG: hypothetical protein ACTHJ7_08115 [Candidatus Nitrosocosmicus sp.]